VPRQIGRKDGSSSAPCPDSIGHLRQVALVAPGEGEVGTVTWYIPKNSRRHSTKDVEQSVLRNVTALQVSKRIAAILPFNHKPLKESDGNPRTDYWVIVLALDANPDKVWQEIK
jgi:hypothetical protein